MWCDEIRNPMYPALLIPEPEPASAYRREDILIQVLRAIPTSGAEAAGAGRILNRAYRCSSSDPLP